MVDNYNRCHLHRHYSRQKYHPILTIHIILQLLECLFHNPLRPQDVTRHRSMLERLLILNLNFYYYKVTNFLSSLAIVSFFAYQTHRIVGGCIPRAQWLFQSWRDLEGFVNAPDSDLEGFENLPDLYEVLFFLRRINR